MQRFRNRNFHVVVVILNNSRFCVENTSYDDANDNQNQRNNISFFDEYFQIWGEHCVLERGDVVMYGRSSMETMTKQLSTTRFEKEVRRKQ